jgi:hypothetical protein
MHPQIKDIIHFLMHRGGRVFVRLSAPEQTPLGKLVGRAYYDSRVLEVLSFNERSGYPHNGGMHTLELHCAPLDAIEMLEMLKEECLVRLCRTEEEREVASQLSFVSQEIHALRRQM